MSERLDHRKGREANEAAILERNRRINHEIGGGMLTEKKMRDDAKRRADAAAERGVREEKG